ncbi:Hsp20/alpha crystallin family protein [Salsipaludibacter albus]|uniref:Hsp20/alpha crystallin family protein n=1 Tax=Salsipaludibacter albus TaxID=2849650 RepID=UPI001EE3C0C2|nr:Hsp20/alpha crystallin family protein [Salsipaludibacter albus]MBY5162046.1 Hsp20/alpha crystallin family protein [Salsipaludibacter albus]
MVTHDIEGSESSGTRDETTTSRSRLMERGDRGGTVRPFAPALDVRETEDAFTLHVELAGVSPDDVEITLEENVLAIRGERSTGAEIEDGTFRRIERHVGRFQRAVRLPARLDGEHVSARFADGVLTITIPKSQESRPRRVPVVAS